MVPRRAARPDPPAAHRAARRPRAAARRPGPRAALAQALLDGAEDVQPPPRAVGVHGPGRRRRAADDPGDRHGRPERGDRARGARRPRRRRARSASGPAGRSIGALGAGRRSSSPPRRWRPTGRAAPWAPTAGRGRRRADRGAGGVGGRRRADRLAPTSSTTRDGAAPRRWREAGALAVEMEAAALFAVGARRGIAVACVLAVSDVLAGGAADRRRRAARPRRASASAARAPRRWSPRTTAARTGTPGPTPFWRSCPPTIATVQPD